jgi:general secretion pathway protein A
VYESFYGMSKNPFSLTPDPSFLVMTKAHGNVKAGLTYAITAGKGFTVLTGEAGTGKTTLLRSVINSIPRERMCFSLVTNPALSPQEFFTTAIGDFGLPKGESKLEDLRNLQTFLLKAHAEGKVAVLFVDEAHRLSVETLEEIRLLTNFETETRKLLQIVLAGQDELGEILDLGELRQLKQRVEVRLEIGPLMADEVWIYIKRRWSCVAMSEPPFSPEAVGLIEKVSGGIPRLINSVCDNALLIGFAEGCSLVTGKHVLEASRDLHLSQAIESGARRSSRSVPAVGRDKTSDLLPLEIPAPVSQNHTEQSLQFSGYGQPKRSWWWPRISRAAGQRDLV